MKTCIVTCYYTKLHGTNFGGRFGLDGRYRDSFMSLLKMTDADFYVFCDPTEIDFLREVASSRMENTGHVFFIPYELKDFYMKDLFERYKDLEEAKISQRCQEIQYSKTYWMKEVIEKHSGARYDYCFWIDIGISHSGLIPDKYMIIEPHRTYECFNNTLYTNPILKGMADFAQDKFLIFAIDNETLVGYRRVIDSYDPEEKYHVIAGILGGKVDTVIDFHNKFVECANRIAIKDETIHDEEVIYNIVWQENRDFFNVKKFVTWYHEDNIPGIAADEEKRDEYRQSKSFYKILEEFHNDPLQLITNTKTPEAGATEQ